MVQGSQFRKVLPVLQTALAVFFGGWGLWLRNSVLSRPFLGGYWLGLDAAISRLAVAVQIRSDSKHASIPRRWTAVLAFRLPPTGTSRMGAGPAAYTFALVLGRVVGRQECCF